MPIDNRHIREYIKLQMKPRSINKMDTGNPVIGANSSSRIGHFQARARQLTSEALGRISYG